jgi:hypothetical protein
MIDRPSCDRARTSGGRSDDGEMWGPALEEQRRGALAGVRPRCSGRSDVSVVNFFPAAKF